MLRFYVKMNFAVCTVGFDGYEKSFTKDHEHGRRIQKQQSRAYVIVKEEVTAHYTREVLCSTRNKAQLIKLLSQHVKEDGNIVITFKDDCCHTNCCGSVRICMWSNVTVVVEDTDIFILHLCFWNSDIGESFMKVNKRRIKFKIW